MKTVLTLAAAGVFALSTTAWAGEGYNCGGYQQSVQTEKPTITLATQKATVGTATTKQTASTGDKTTKPGS
ncbi:unnamed protein product [Discosporangium mesarthrocarpum]